MPIRKQAGKYREEPFTGHVSTVVGSDPESDSVRPMGGAQRHW